MHSMSDRAGGAWHPSLGAIYPTIVWFEDEGLVTSGEEGGRLVTVTSEKRGRLEERSAGLGDLFADFADAPTGPDPPDRLSRVHAALCQIEVGGDAIQLQAAVNGSLLVRRSLRLILARE